MQIYVNQRSQKYVIKLNNFCHMFVRILWKFSTYRQIKAKQLPDYPRRSQQQSKELNIPVFCGYFSVNSWEILEDVFVTIVTFLSWNAK